LIKHIKNKYFGFQKTISLSHSLHAAAPFSYLLSALFSILENHLSASLTLPHLNGTAGRSFATPKGYQTSSFNARYRSAGEASKMEVLSNENSQQAIISTNDAEDHHDSIASNTLSHGAAKPKLEDEISNEEVRSILEIIASTGKYWHDWEKLKSILSFRLKQVLSEYPEAEMTSEQQSASLGEMYAQLVARLDEALLSFTEGPPFTLQRLCEILLAARSIYPSLSKLALALEKNLLVSSTLTICLDLSPQITVQKPVEPDKANGGIQLHSNSEQNGVEPMLGDRDEVMTEVEEADIDDDMTIDMESLEEIVGSSKPNSTTKGNN
ncbi:PPP4R2 domain-containing protein, partial [Cephalotus follicularis]